MSRVFASGEQSIEASTFCYTRRFKMFGYLREREKALLLIYIVVCACENTGGVQLRLKFPRESRPAKRSERILVCKLEPFIQT